MSKKNDSGIVYSLIYYLYSQKWVRKMTEEIVYSLIYYHLQSKIEWKIGKKNESKNDSGIVYSLI